MRRALLLLLVLLAAGPAAAHSLRVFAKVEGRQVSGYAFFIGGGRPAGVSWVAKMDRQTIASGVTDADGGYGFTAPESIAGDVTITVDTHEGHIASVDLPPRRFGAPEDSPQTAAAEPASADVTREMVETAVERQVAPLLERIEAMDTRMRFTDVISGIFLIIGLAGIALWARGRKR